MPFGNLRGGEILLLLLIVVLLFGARRLPDLARSIGQSLKIFKNEVRNPDDAEQPGAQPPSGPAGPTGGTTLPTPEPPRGGDSPPGPTTPSV